MTSKNIGTLIQTLNAKAAAAGEDIRAVHVTIDATWGDNCGVAILGTGDRERAARFVAAYYSAHLASKRCYNTQYSCDDMGEVGMIDTTNGPQPARRYSEEPAFTGRVFSLVYYPCAD